MSVQSRQLGVSLGQRGYQHQSISIYKHSVMSLGHVWRAYLQSGGNNCLQASSSDPMTLPTVERSLPVWQMDKIAGAVKCWSNMSISCPRYNPRRYYSTQHTGKDVLYLTTHSTHFIYGYMASDTTYEYTALCRI